MWETVDGNVLKILHSAKNTFPFVREETDTLEHLEAVLRPRRRD